MKLRIFLPAFLCAMAAFGQDTKSVAAPSAPQQHSQQAPPTIASTVDRQISGDRKANCGSC